MRGGSIGMMQVVGCGALGGAVFDWVLDIRLIGRSHEIFVLLW